jgi:hypothetical protein
MVLARMRNETSEDTVRPNLVCSLGLKNIDELLKEE